MCVYVGSRDSIYGGGNVSLSTASCILFPAKEIYIYIYKIDSAVRVKIMQNNCIYTNT